MAIYSCVIWYIELNYVFVFVGSDLCNRQIWVLLQWSHFVLTIPIPVDLFDSDSNSWNLGYDFNFNTIFTNVSDFDIFICSPRSYSLDIYSIVLYLSELLLKVNVPNGSAQCV